MSAHGSLNSIIITTYSIYLGNKIKIRRMSISQLLSKLKTCVKLRVLLYTFYIVFTPVFEKYYLGPVIVSKVKYSAVLPQQVIGSLFVKVHLILCPVC